MNQSGAARARRSSAISATLVSPRSAELLYEPSEQAKAAIGKGVTVVDDPPWPLSFRYKAVELAYRTFDNVR